MAITIQSLPNETLREILTNLSINDLRSARLSFTNFANNGALLLFKVIHFAPRDDVLRNFTQIIEHSFLNKTVEELVYDARLFLPMRFHQDGDTICKKYCVSTTSTSIHCGWTLVNRGPQELRSKAVTIASKYNGFFAEQQAIFNHKEDLRMLCAGFARMTKVKLNKISIRYDLFYDAKKDVCYPRGHEAYVRRTTSALGLSLPPSPEAWATGELSWFWGFQGIANLFRAMTMSKFQPTSLQIGSDDRHTLPLELFAIFADSNFHLASNTFTVDINSDFDWAKRISSLKLMIAWQSAIGHDHVRRNDQALTGCRGFLGSLQSLTILELTGTWGSNNQLWARCFEGIYLPHLKQLNLQVLEVSPEQLGTLLSRHKDTIHELSLNSMCLTNLTAADGDWGTMTKGIGDILQLDCACICRLACQDSVFLYDDEQLDLIDQDECIELVGTLMGNSAFEVQVEFDEYWNAPIVTARLA